MNIKIAMWSGPRNVSTALMRSFDARADTVVCDEPLYAHYLSHTGLDHPLASQVIQEHENDWHAVTQWLSAAPPQGAQVFYQKHMAHHLLPHIGRDWLASLTHAFLIRNPRAMLRSLLRVLPEPRLEDTGLPQQVQLFEEIVKQNDGKIPPILDSELLLRDPRAVLEQMCYSVGIPFLESMLSWKAGPRDTDGAWAPAWYSSVERSTGFLPYQPASTELDKKWEGLAQACEELYEQLRPHALGG